MQPSTGRVLAVLVCGAMVSTVLAQGQGGMQHDHRKRPGPPASPSVPWTPPPPPQSAGPINVPSYSPPISPYPARPIQPPENGRGRHGVIGHPPHFERIPDGAFAGSAAAYHYYCPQLGGYYPQVTQCPSAWTAVPAQPHIGR